MRVHNKYITALWLTVILLLTSGFNVSASQVNDPEIVVILSYDAYPYQEALSGFQDHLRKVSAHTVLQIYTLNDNPADSEEAVQRILTGKPRIIFTLGRQATEMARNVTGDIPIIAGMVLDETLFKSASNITGVLLKFPIETQLMWIQRFLPHTRNVGVIYNPNGNQKKIDAARKIARELGLNLEAQPVYSPQGLSSALAALENRADVLWGVTDTLVLNPQTAKHILLFSFRNRIPFVGLSRAWVKAGALYSLEWDYKDIGTQCAEMVLEVSNGKRMGNIPSVRPRKIKYSVNQKTAVHMKIEFPNTLIKDALAVY